MYTESRLKHPEECFWRISFAQSRGRLTHISPMLDFKQKPINWFAMQIKWLVSIRDSVLGSSGLNQVSTAAAFQLFKSQPYKMVKHTQTIRQLLSANCLDVFDYLVGLALKGLKLTAISKADCLKLRWVLLDESSFISRILSSFEYFRSSL